LLTAIYRDKTAIFIQILCLQINALLYPPSDHNHYLDYIS